MFSFIFSGCKLEKSNNIDNKHISKEVKNKEIKDEDFFNNNRKLLYENIEENSMVLLFAGIGEGEFISNRNLYYLTGIEEENSILVITKIDSKIEEVIFINPPDSNRDRWIGKSLSIEEVSAISGINNVEYNNSFMDYINQIIKDVDNAYIDLENYNFDAIKAMERSNKFISFKPTIDQSFALELHEKNDEIYINNINNILGNSRMIKNAKEIEKVKSAIKITKLGLENIMKNTKPNIWEYQLEAYYNFILDMNGIKRTSFESIIASGQNATILHYSDNDSKINENELVLIDVGVVYNQYCSDITRTIPSNGKFTDRQKEMYNIVLNAQKQVLDNIKPGVSFKQLNEIAKINLSRGLSNMGFNENLNEYYPHFIGHQLGLDTHDLYGEGDILKENMVITIEPGIYIEDEKIGIRIEDNILVTKDGYINLSEDIIKSVEEIEKFMVK
ncbi:aminopeptidase P family protein [Clostridium sp. D2Q-11]|uniref:Xaa-Pro aminopeptidase n=2 Tax=Anaeromonas frigoriresistens TaxID=2683708 RepID=A0A942V3D2_9FIRM|nr:aminopeptidase P family protein [Anaeromonas frigoriresistens]